MSEKKEYNRIFYIVFENTKNTPWWQLFLDKEINHCYAITPVDDNNSIMLTQTLASGIEITAFRTNISDLALNIIEHNKKVIRMIATQNINTKLRLRLFRDCVGLCKDLIGLDKPFMVTPKQLYRYLKTRGEY